MPIIRLENLLKPGSDSNLAEIIQNAKKLEGLTVTLRGQLETEAASHLLAANVRDDGELVLICSSSAWASRLRFDSQALLEAANAAGVPATSCRVTVARQLPGDG